MLSKCNNCGKLGHLFHQCKLPITSYGIIVFRKSENGLQLLMIRRKDSFGYIDFIRGKYIPYNIEQIQNCVNEMSIPEKLKLLNTSFDVLWKNMWGNININQYKSEEYMSLKKFNTIMSGIVVEDICDHSFSYSSKLIKLEDVINMSNTSWVETEWEFPKGRRNQMEKDLDCALREFEEETGYSRYDISIIENIFPLEEIFIGSNHKSYKHKYFLAMINSDDDVDVDMKNYQKTEVSKLEWKTVQECISCIRPYNLEKKRLIETVDYILREYDIY